MFVSAGMIVIVRPRLYSSGLTSSGSVDDITPHGAKYARLPTSDFVLIVSTEDVRRLVGVGTLPRDDA